MRDTSVDIQVVKAAVQLACRAPSLHNSQPWRWVTTGRSTELFLDPERAPRYTDTSSRASLIGCGAALDHFRVAMAAAGWIANVDRFPNPNDLHHLASIDFSQLAFVTDGHRRRAEAIRSRHTDRLPFSRPPGWDRFAALLHSTVSTEKVRIDVIADALRPELVEATEFTESLRLYDSSYHAEIGWWTTRAGESDGIPQNALVSAAESERVDVGRAFPVTQDQNRRPEVDEDHSKIAVLSTYDDTHDAVLRCGEALSAVLLEATLAGLATCTLSHITELPASRAVVARLVGQPSTPQILVRIGVAPDRGNAPPPTPRRPIDEVLTVHIKDR
jgi:hypothetical protein